MVQYGYRYENVLIDASRVLDSQFSDTVLQVTGAQLELLRNMTQYLNRRTTFVDTYYPGYYELPDDADWDTISAIVADIEEELMGNQNTIFGYKERYFESWQNDSHAAGAQLLETLPVDAGFVHVIQQIEVFRNGVSGEPLVLRAFTETTGMHLEDRVDTVAGKPNVKTLNLVLKEEDYLRADFSNTTEDEVLKLIAWGYKMKVPE